jgi:hypothetical protein
VLVESMHMRIFLFRCHENVAPKADRFTVHEGNSDSIQARWPNPRQLNRNTVLHDISFPVAINHSTKLFVIHSFSIYLSFSVSNSLWNHVTYLKQVCFVLFVILCTVYLLCIQSIVHFSRHYCILILRVGAIGHNYVGRKGINNLYS